MIPSYIVIWELEDDGDPCETFMRERHAKEKVQELLNDDDVIKTSIKVYQISAEIEVSEKIIFTTRRNQSPAKKKTKKKVGRPKKKK